MNSAQPEPVPDIQPLHAPSPKLFRDTAADETGSRTPAESWARPVTLREIIAVLTIVVLCDLTIYRAGGWAGMGVLFIAYPVLLLVATLPCRCHGSVWLVFLLLTGLAARMIWCASPLAAWCGAALIFAFSLGLAGMCPFWGDILRLLVGTLLYGYRGLKRYDRAISGKYPTLPRPQWTPILMPLAAIMVFGTIFLFANPDLLESVKIWRDEVGRWLEYCLQSFSVHEWTFCIVSLWVAVALTFPKAWHQHEDGKPQPQLPQAPTPLYGAFRNTLIAVTLLFAAYLVFEVNTLWFREFPPGFYYSGYAHEGAAWLTVALALATIFLSVLFRQGTLRDPRMAKLRGWAWLWSLENFILVAAVFHRLFIYVNYNGMTRMRVVGMLGVASVAVGFALVVIKIVLRRDFRWLVRRQLWTVSFAVFLYALLPVDAFVNDYNVRQILAGNLAPSTQITGHPTSHEGLLFLIPLIHCEDPIIREGTLALLADSLDEWSKRSTPDAPMDWTRLQIAEMVLMEKLQNLEEPRSISPTLRQAARARFRAYTYQWW